MMTIRNSGRCKVLGILGGMGPEATVDFYRQVIALTPANCDQEHIPTIIYSHTEVPDRTESIMKKRHDCLPPLLDGVTFLEQAGAEVIAIPCNTAHYYIEEMRVATAVAILSIIEETVGAVLAAKCVPRHIAVFSTEVMRVTDLYGRALEAFGVHCHYPEADIQKRIMDIIGSVKSGKAGAAERDELIAMAEDLRKAGTEALLLGCTELPILLRDQDTGLPLFDSTSILAKAAVRFCFRSGNSKKEFQ
jgi:aspartate racemase